jgi:hypothetical protein
MEAFLTSFFQIHATIGEEQKKQQHHHHQRKRKRKATAVTASKSTSRYIAWSDNERKSYTLLRNGIPLLRRDDADRLYESNGLKEAHFYIFCHKDPHMNRNALVPKYEAAYFFSQTSEFVRVKKCHLKAAYQGLGRCMQVYMWTIDADGLPYWVDRHAFSKKKQQRSKRKYEASKG